MRQSLFLQAAVVLLTVSCATSKTAQPEVAAKPAAPAPAPASAEVKKWVADLSKPMPPGLDEAAMDLNADPCTDFYQYACGGWMSKTEIPGDRAIYSRGFVSILERNEMLLKSILDDAANNKLPKDTAFAKQMGDYFGTCMDEPKLEKAFPTVKKLIEQVTVVKNANDVATALVRMHSVAMPAMFGVGAQQDLKKSDEVILGLDQGGLGLPDRDYYTEPGEKNDAIRKNYEAYVAQMLELAGEKADDAKAHAAKIMAFETRLAKVSQTKVERRSPEKLYNRVDRKGLKEKAAAFNWDKYLDGMGLKKIDAINVNSIPYFEEIGAIAKEANAEALKPYFTWVVIRSTVPALPKKFQDAAFKFSSENFTGQKEDRLRWKKCVSFADGDLGEALGREFARRYFGEDAKARTNAMVESLQKSFEKNLTTLPWMDEPTKAAALTKVQKMVSNNKVGYPNAWRDYAALKTDRSSFVSNSLAANAFEMKRQLAKIGKPVDRQEWLMSPPTVNAYYEPQKNEIVFPAGILQPPFFNKEATDAVNFGAMGMVVGHEITHGFDDEGRQFDVDGNLKDWWSEKVGKDFVDRAQCVKRQYDNYTAIEDLKLNGQLTLGENIADLGGLKLAHSAMNDWYAKKGGDENFRYDRSQQFFLGMAQSWCTKVRPEAARLRAKTDPHANPYWRVNGPMGNLDAFKTAFQCTDSAKMMRTGADRCTVW